MEEFQNQSFWLNSSTSSSESSTEVPAYQISSYHYKYWLRAVIPGYIYTISALGIPLNLLVLLVFLLHKKACTATEIYLSNMAAADLFLLTFLPLWCKQMASEYSWTFNGLCKFVALVLVMNYNFSVYFRVLIGVDRYLALMHPLSHCKLRKRKYAMLSCVAVWCFGFLSNIPTLVCIQNDYHYCVQKCSTKVNRADEVVQLVVAFLIPLLVISFCTVKILQALKERSREGISSHQSEREVTFPVFVVLLAFLICWLPFRVLTIVVFAMTIELIEFWVYDICYYVLISLGFFNSILNPVLYVILDKNFRKKSSEVLSGCGLGRNSSAQFDTTATSSIILSSQRLQDRDTSAV